jgi:hypothetical protein
MRITLAFRFLWNSFLYATGSGSINRPVQLRSISKNRLLELNSPSWAPHSIKNPFLRPRRRRSINFDWSLYLRDNKWRHTYVDKIWYATLNQSSKIAKNVPSQKPPINCGENLCRVCFSKTHVIGQHRNNVWAETIFKLHFKRFKPHETELQIESLWP